MGFLKRAAASPPALIACLVLGAMLGHFFPAVGMKTSVLGQLYLAIVSMAALPLLVVATFFGLRQTLALPQPTARILMIAGVASLLVALSAGAGTLAGVLGEPGGHLDAQSRAYLGRLVQQAGRSAGDTEMMLTQPADEDGDAKPAMVGGTGIVPDNFFKALAEGRSLGILVCAIAFGLAFAALGRQRNSALTGMFEAVYRALENIISQVNLFIPLVVFSMAAFFVSRTDAATLGAMGAFLGWFMLLAFGGSVIGAALVARQCGATTWQVIQALQDPAIIALTSASTTASIPSTIEAMSSRLGFSRGIVELVTPIASVFMRSGSAIYYALATVFVANLYATPLDPQDLLLITGGAFLASFASSGNNSVGNVAYAGMVLAMLQLPAEAVLALFVAIDLLCEGPRNLFSLMTGCVLMALVSHGLPAERQAAAESGSVRIAPIRFVFTRADLLVGAACTVVVAALIVVLGFGVGLKRGPPQPSVVGQPAAVEKPV